MTEKQPGKTRFLANLALNDRSRLLRTQERQQLGVTWIKTMRHQTDSDFLEQSIALETHLPRLGLEEKESENRVILSKIRKAKEEFKRTLDDYHAKQNGFQKKALLLSFFSKREPSEGSKGPSRPRRGSKEPTTVPKTQITNTSLKRSTYHDFEVAPSSAVQLLEERPGQSNDDFDHSSTLDEAGFPKLTRKLASLTAKIRKFHKISEDLERTDSFAHRTLVQSNLNELKSQITELSRRIDQERTTRISMVGGAIAGLEEELAKIDTHIQELNRFFQASNTDRRRSMQLTENKTGGLKESALRYINDEIDRIERALETQNSRSRSKLGDEAALGWVKPPDWRFLMSSIYLALFVRFKNIDRDFLRSICTTPTLTVDRWKKIFGCLGSPPATSLLIDSINGVLGDASPENKIGLLNSVADFLEASEQEIVRAGKFRSLKGITELLGRLERAHSLDRTPLIDFLMSDFPWQYFRNATIVYFFLVNSSMFLTSQFRLCQTSMAFVTGRDRKRWEPRGPAEVDVMAKINGMLLTNSNT
jgi:hypothetical protein